MPESLDCVGFADSRMDRKQEEKPDVPGDESRKERRKRRGRRSAQVAVTNRLDSNRDFNLATAREHVRAKLDQRTRISARSGAGVRDRDAFQFNVRRPADA